MTCIKYEKNKLPVCTIKFNTAPGNTHVSQILAGYKMLADRKLLKIKKAIPYTTFRTEGNYEHNSIVEVDFDDIIIAYDMADGYQSIHRKDVFDSQLVRLSFYFKRSYNPTFHKDMKNSDKVRPLSLNYLCSCEGNPYDDFYFKKYDVTEFKSYIAHQKNKKNNVYHYRDFESNGKMYEDYNLLFLTRLWDSSTITVQGLQATYPYFTESEAEKEAEKWKYSLDVATKNRIEYIKELKKHFGDRIITGVSNDDFSRKVCPELIIDESITSRNNYIRMIKENYVCLTSEGLHHSIGWKFAEYVAAGKAIVTEPLYYEVPYGFSEGLNYLAYNSLSSCIEKCEYLLSDVGTIHKMEEANRKYYAQHLRPDMLVLDSLKIALPEYFI